MKQARKDRSGSRALTRMAAGLFALLLVLLMYAASAVGQTVDFVPPCPVVDQPLHDVTEPGPASDRVGMLGCGGIIAALRRRSKIF